MGDVVALIAVGFQIYLIVTIIVVLLDNREPSSTLAWILVFIFIPVFGFILYVFFGRNWRHASKVDRIHHQFIESQLVHILKDIIDRQFDEIKKIRQLWVRTYKKELIRLLYRTSNSLLTGNNQVRIFHSGAGKFEALKADLRDAQRSIHLEYFIWRSDPLTQEIASILKQKAKEGVEVRILYDFLGSLFLSKKYVEDLRRAGVKIYPYFNFLSVFKVHTLNYRNHRKIAIIDGKIGYTGGMNMGQEYIDGGRRFTHWRDTHLRVFGEAVLILQAIFTVDWYNTTEEALFKAPYFPIFPSISSLIPIQISTSGPDSEWPSIKQLYFALIMSAKKRVYIESPYFIPDPSIYMALKTAALGGLDVRVVVAGIPDKKLPYWSAFTYFEDLLRAGVRIYQYKKGFMHAKVVAIDSEICSVGTANMDIRSFQLNYEMNTLIYDKAITAEVEAQFDQDLRDATEITLRDYRQIRPFKRLRNSLARLLTPLL
jgi:cardiolipin synthase